MNTLMTNLETMTPLETLIELAKNYGLDASVEISSARGNPAALMKPAPDSIQTIVFTLLEPLCKEISFTVPEIRYVIVDFGGPHPPTIVDCSQYQI